MKIFVYIYYYVTTLTGYKSACDGLVKNLFEKAGGFQTGFFIAFCVGLIIALLYYLVCCNFSFKLAKRGIWIIVLLFTGIFAYLLTNYYAKGVFKELLKVEANDRRALCSGTLDEIANCNATISMFTTNSTKFINRPNSYLILYSVGSAFYAMIFFFIISFLIKDYTVYGKSIPFEKARKNKGQIKN